MDNPPPTPFPGPFVQLSGIIKEYVKSVFMCGKYEPLERFLCKNFFLLLFFHPSLIIPDLFVFGLVFSVWWTITGNVNPMCFLLTSGTFTVWCAKETRHQNSIKSPVYFRKHLKLLFWVTFQCRRRCFERCKVILKRKYS